MAITVNNLTGAAGSGGGASKTTASISPTANSVIIAAIYNKLDPSGGNTPTCSGLSLTWDQVLTQSSGKTKLTIFRAFAGASPGSGTVTFDFGGQSQQNTSYNIAEFVGAKTTGTNASEAVVQSSATALNGSMSGATQNLSALANPLNAVYAAVGWDGAQTINAGSNFTGLTLASGGTDSFGSEYAINQTACDFTWSSSTVLGVIAALEIAIAPTDSGGYYFTSY